MNTLPPHPGARRPLRRAAALTGTAMAFALATAAPSASQEDPPGNNGTVKVDGIEFDSHPDNEPPPGCVFQIDFYGFDEGVGDATVSFELQPAIDGTSLEVTSGDLTPDIGEDPAGGGTDVDAQETYTLGFTGEPQSPGGYGVKLTIHAPGSQGADVKHKVFRVGPCEDVPSSTTTTAPPTTAAPTTTTAAPTTTTAPPTTVPPTTVTPTTVPPTTAAPTTTAPPAAEEPVDLGEVQGAGAAQRPASDAPERPGAVEGSGVGQQPAAEHNRAPTGSAVDEAPAAVPLEEAADFTG